LLDLRREAGARHPSHYHTAASQSAQADFVWLLQRLQSPAQGVGTVP
jgi:hypothetical protein